FGAMGGASAAFTLHRLIADQTGYRGEFQIPESLPMCAADRVSDLDRREAYACGRHAIETARNGYSGVMVTIRRTADAPYASEMDTEPLAEVARRTHHLPERYYDPESRQPTEAFRQYARPLVGELSPYTTLDEVSSIAERRHS
ncbi:MAG: phosphofructokinase, partial [Spirochaetaceae bacterium]